MGCCRPQFQAAGSCCSVISALSEHGKKKKWEHCDPQKRDQSLTGSYHSVGTYSQLQGNVGNWDILLFLLQSSLSARLFSHSCPYSCFLFVSHRSSFLPFAPLLSFLPVLIIFPFPLLSVFLSPLHLSRSPPHPQRHPWLPILIALPTGGHSQAELPGGCIVSTSFIERSQYIKRTEREKREHCGDLCFPFSVVSHQSPVLPTASAASKRKESLLNASHFELLTFEEHSTRGAVGVTQSGTFADTK